MPLLNVCRLRCARRFVVVAVEGLYLNHLRCIRYFQNYKNMSLRSEFAAILGEMTCVFR